MTTNSNKETNKGERLGYIRVSTVEQNTGRQEGALKALSLDRVFIEKRSGKDTDRPQLQALLNHMRKGDTIYIESFSRLARNTKDLLNLLETITSKGVGIVSLKEQIDTTTASGKLMVTLIGAVATFERDIMLERQREGIALAKAQGKYKGRAYKTIPKEFEELYSRYMRREFSKVKLAELLKVSRPVLDRFIKEYKEQQQQQ